MRFRGNLPDILMLVSFFFFSTWSWTISSLIMRNQERLAKPANYLPGSKRLTVQWETVSSQIAKYLTFPGPTAIFKLIALKETFLKKYLIFTAFFENKGRWLKISQTPSNMFYLLLENSRKATPRCIMFTLHSWYFCLFTT